MKLTHKVLGEFDVNAEPTHGNIVTFYEELRAAEYADHSVPYYDGWVVKAAITANILKTAVDVDNAKPALINWLARELEKHVNAQREIPKN